MPPQGTTSFQVPGRIGLTTVTYPLRPIKDITEELDPQAKYFVTLDTKGSYWQIALTDDSQM